MEKLFLQIRRHISSLKNMQLETDLVFEQVDEITAEARQKLREYQIAKRQANVILDSVADEYKNAYFLFKQSESLYAKLETIKAKHIKLCNAALGIAEEQPEKAKDMLLKLKEAQWQLRRIYERIEIMREESRFQPEEDAQEREN